LDYLKRKNEKRETVEKVTLENAALENAGRKVNYRKTRECIRWNAKMHLSVCKKLLCVSAVYLSLRVFARRFILPVKRWFYM